MEDKLADEEKGDLPKTSLEYATTKEPVKTLPKLSHYSIVQQMYNYHAVDFGDKCKGSDERLVFVANTSRVICVGANWMHRKSNTNAANILEEEGRQRRLYSWLVLCNDSMAS